MIYTRNFLLRLTVAVILFMHSVPAVFNGGIYDFGKMYLDPIGFAPFGLVLAWCIKLVHVAGIITLLLNRWIKWPAIANIAILATGIVMVHFKEGWFVVGGGRNGVEFNLLLIAVLLHILFSANRYPTPVNR
jgi:putative oxidoreductase